MRRINRRQFIAVTGSGAAASFLLTFGRGEAAAQTSQAPTSLRTDSARVFDLSVASGDPSSSGVVIWTHIRADAFESAMPLWFQVASDASFNVLVLEGLLPAGSVIASSDHCVSVDLQGRLSAGATYFYRFIYGDTVSRVGRCRTLPVGSPSRLRVAVVSCQDYTNGYYGAWRHVAADDVDFVLHLGDFIYESVGDPRFQSMPFADRHLHLPSGSAVAVGLSDYRYLYRSYRADPYLQAALERHTIIAIPDDHETANDCYWDYARDTLGAPDHPYAQDAARLRQLKLDAQRAWLDYLPARVTRVAGATHPHAYTTVYRGFEFGDLARISVIDNRTYRTPHPCGEGDIGSRYLPVGCTNATNPTQSILGDTQRTWLANRFTSSAAIWNVLGNQTYMGRLSLGFGAIPINVDAWDGYETERRYLADVIANNRIKNVVVLTGDMHSYIASSLLRNYGNINPLDTSNIVGTEFMTPSMTSFNLLETLRGQLSGARESVVSGLTEAAVRVNNPHIKYFNSSQYGYSTVEFGRDRCDWTAYVVDKNADPSLAERRSVARYRKLTWWPWLVNAGA